MPLWVSALVATLFVQTVSSFASQSLPLLGPPLMARLGLPPEGIGLLSAATSVGICWCLACGGPMLAHHGAVRTLQFGLLCSAGGLVLLLQPLGLLGMLGALAVGFGIGHNTPAGSQILLRASPPRRRSLIFSVKQAGVPLGGALAGLLLPPLAEAVGLAATLWAVVAVALVSALLVQPFRRRLDADRGGGHPGWGRALFAPDSVRRALRTLRGHPSLPMLAALGASFSVLQACLMAFVATYAVARHGATLAEAGRVAALMLASSIAGRVGLGWLADRTGHAPRYLAAQALLSALAVAALVAFGGQGPAALLGCAALVGVTAVGWNGVHIAEVARLAPPGQVGEVTAASGLVGFVGSVIGPPLFAAIVAWSGSYDGAFLAAAAQLAAFGLVAALAGARPGRG